MNTKKMKKILSQSFLIPLSLSLIPLFITHASADFMSMTPSPYSFGPEGRPVEDMKEFSKPKDMVTIVPNHPVQATDKYGNKEYFTPSGTKIATVAKDGSISLSLGGTSIEQNASGQLLKKSTAVKGTNKVEITNDNGEVIGYRELAKGGQVVKEYDYQQNLTKTYKYDNYGKNAQYVLDELTQTKTVFDSKGKAVYDVNYEGAKVAWYQYDDKGRIEKKTDIQQNKTYYDKSGNMTYTEDQYKNVLVKYNYIKDDNGHWILNTSVDYESNTTEYKNGKPKFEKAKDGSISKEYVYNGLTLLYTYNTGNRETIWYDIDGKELISTFDDSLKRKWLYSDGKLIGLYDASSCMVTYYIHGQEVQQDRVNGCPTVEEIRAKLDSGEIRKKYQY